VSVDLSMSDSFFSTDNAWFSGALPVGLWAGSAVAIQDEGPGEPPGKWVAPWECDCRCNWWDFRVTLVARLWPYLGPILGSFHWI
jgi:hypothetical protein